MTKLERSSKPEGSDTLHEAKRLRLLAAALELQHFSSTETNILHIPGGDRVIVIGTPAQVRALLGDDATTQTAPTDAEKALQDAMRYGTGAMLDGKRVPYADVFQADSEGGHHD